MTSSGGTFQLTQVNDLGAGANPALKNIAPYQNLTLVQKHSYEKARHISTRPEIMNGVVHQLYQPHDTPHTLAQKRPHENNGIGARRRMIRKKFGFREIRAGKVKLNSEGSLSVVASSVKLQPFASPKSSTSKKRKSMSQISKPTTTKTAASYMRPTTSQASRVSARSRKSRRTSTPISVHSRSGKGKRSQGSVASMSSVFSVYSSQASSQATSKPPMVPAVQHQEDVEADMNSEDFHKSVSEVAAQVYAKTPKRRTTVHLPERAAEDRITLNPSTVVSTTQYSDSDYSSLPSSVYSSRIFELEEALRKERQTRHQFEEALMEVQNKQDVLLQQLDDVQKEKLEEPSIVQKPISAKTNNSQKIEKKVDEKTKILTKRLASTETELNKLKTIVNTLTNHLATSSIDDDRMKKILSKIHETYPEAVRVPPMMPTNPVNDDQKFKSTRKSYTQNYSGSMICQFP